MALGREEVSDADELVREAREYTEERAMKYFYPLVALAEALVSLASGVSARGLECRNQAEEHALELGMRPLVWQARAPGPLLDGMGRQAERSPFDDP